MRRALGSSSRWSIWLAVIATALSWMAPPSARAQDGLDVEWGCFAPFPGDGSTPIVHCYETCIPTDPGSLPLMPCGLCAGVVLDDEEIARVCP